MKKLLCFLLLPLLFLSACGEKTLSADCSLSELREEILSFTKIEEPVLPTEEAIRLRYGTEQAQIGEYAVILEPGAVFYREILIFKAENEESATVIEQSLQAYRQSLLEQSRSYEPEFFALAEKSRVQRQGLYLSLFLHPMQEELEQLFAAHLREYESGTAPIFTPVTTAEPSAAPTPPEETPPPPTATPAPPEEPPAPRYGLVEESEPVADEWFDDALFVGNSVMQNLENYVFARRMGDAPDCLGKAEFLDVTRYSYRLIAGHNVIYALQPSFHGQDNFTLEMALAYTGCKKVYLHLGYSDLMLDPRGLPETMQAMDETVKLIRSVAGEETEIYLLAITPRIEMLEAYYPNSVDFRAFNAELLAYAEEPENRCHYLDCYTMLADDRGFLPEDYCTDPGSEGIHLNADACQRWVEYLYTHTAANGNALETNKGKEEES